MAAFALLHEKLFIHKYHIDRNHVYYISGVNVFSLSLYYYLKENGIDSRLTAGDQEQKETLQMLKQKQMVDDFVTSIENEEQAVVIQTDDTQVCTQKKDSVLTYDDINSIICQKTKEDLKQFENCNQGKRAFIVALGPSITIRDLEKLEQQHELTISMNSIYYMLDKTTWRPDYYVISDGTGIRDYEKDLKEGLTKYLEKSEKFFSDNYLKFWDTAHDGTYHCFHQIQNIYDIEFTSDFSEKVYAGATVVYACIQLAVYMGIKNIYLLGCDFSFSNNLKGAENHCYGRESVFYNFDFEGTLRGYECAKKYADEHGIKIYNATRGGKLEVFERVDFDSLF
jgi:hypothetical protein